MSVNSNITTTQTKESSNISFGLRYRSTPLEQEVFLEYFVFDCSYY